MRPPLDHMRIRKDSSHNLYGPVRDNGTTRHDGWDLVARPLTPVYAVADGTVADVGFARQYRVGDKVKGTYGRYVILTLEKQFHDGKQLFAFYAHLSHISVGQGGRVVAGQQIGLTGTTGYPYEHHKPVVPSDEAHLHFEFRTVGDPHDPHLSRHGGRVDPAVFWPHQLATVHRH